jgi:hypothetical protein
VRSADFSTTHGQTRLRRVLEVMGEALKVLLLACAGGALVSGSASCLLALLALAPWVALGGCREKGERSRAPLRVAPREARGRREVWGGIFGQPETRSGCGTGRAKVMRGAGIGTTARRGKAAYRVR